MILDLTIQVTTILSYKKRIEKKKPEGKMEKRVRKIIFQKATRKKKKKKKSYFKKLFALRQKMYCSNCRNTIFPSTPLA
jgi:hypothetical protein